jgi:membrane-associated protein
MIYEVFDFIIHFDKYLGEIINSYGSYAYLILFLIIFLETGLVITPLLPGDSLLFIAGTFSSQGFFNIYLLVIILFISAVLGDSINYSIGKVFGEKAFSGNRFFKKEYLLKTQEFYRIHGGKTIIMARFIPIIRTFAPFVAGMSKMNYLKFFYFNIIGAFLWIGLFTFSGYFFGNIEFVKNNLTIITLGIIFLSILPPILQYFRKR